MVFFNFLKTPLGRYSLITVSLNTFLPKSSTTFTISLRKYIEAGKDQQGKGFDPRKLLAPGAETASAMDGSSSAPSSMVFFNFLKTPLGRYSLITVSLNGGQGHHGIFRQGAYKGGAGRVVISVRRASGYV